MPVTTLPHSVIPAGIFPSPGLFTLLCWPFLVTWVLWVSERAGRAQEMAYAGMVISALGLLGCSHGLALSEGIALALESCVPALLFMQLHPHGEGKGRLGGREGERLPFLVVGCVLMGFCLRSMLAVTVVIGAGSVLLAWWDGRAIRRAFPAWMMARLRLCGVVLSALGAVLLHGVPSEVTPEAAQNLGIVLSVLGLAMMAGLGSAATAAPELDMLDVGLRFAALTVMVHLAVYPLARHLMLLSGLIALLITMLGRGSVFPLLPCLTGLGVVAAATEQETALLLLQAGALLGTVLRVRASFDPKEQSTLPERALLPVMLVVLLQLGHVLPLGALVMLLLCLALGLRDVRLADPSHHGWRFWVGQDQQTRLLVSLLMILAFVGVCLSGWNTVPGWRV
ncbi:hypothetical protein [Saccharibacter floricola]|uniref:hypothetical protein n=1 Tax=Saccharibacter floricola TaxID=231053 RepID=UPI00035DFD7A|nr:hypothetical protein [Saccharibacter floricola]